MKSFRLLWGRVLFVIVFTKCIWGSFHNILALTNNVGEMALSFANERDMEVKVCQQVMEIDSIPSDVTCFVPKRREMSYKGIYHTFVWDFVFTELPLDSEVTYWIECVVSDDCQPSQKHTFKVNDRRRKRYKFLAVGDGGIEHEPYRYFLNISNRYYSDFDFAIFPGDFSFDDHDITKFDTQFRKSEELNARFPVMYVSGNHDNLTSVTNRIPTHRVANDSGSTSNLYYSFDYGNIHFVGLSTDIDYGMESAQMKWLIEDLKNVNRKRTDLIIAYFHQVLVMSHTYHSEQAVEARKIFDPIFYQYRVSVTITAHVHNFERSCVIQLTDDGTESCNRDKYDDHSNTYHVNSRDRDEDFGIVHIVSGTLGRDLHTKDTNEGLKDPTPYVSLKNIFSHGVLEVENSKRRGLLSFSFVSTDEETRGEVLDEFYIRYREGRKASKAAAEDEMIIQMVDSYSFDVIPIVVFLVVLLDVVVLLYLLRVGRNVRRRSPQGRASV